MSITCINSLVSPSSRFPSERVNRYDYDETVQSYYSDYFDFHDDLELCRKNKFRGKFTYKLLNALINENRLIQAVEHMVEYGVTDERTGTLIHYTLSEAHWYVYRDDFYDQ